MDDDSGIWWHVAVDGDRVVVQHGRYDAGELDEAAATVRVGLEAACKLAVGLVHAALELDSGRAQALMLALYADELLED